MSQIPLSIQLYTVRDAFAESAADTLRCVSEAGYRNVEMAGLGGHTALEMKTMLADNNLQAPSAHVGIDVLQGDGLAQIAEDYRILGVRTIVVPYLTDQWRQGGQGYAYTAEVINQIAARLHQEGFDTAYHNHDFEFKDKDADGKSGWQILMENTDPDMVKIELDTYWVLFAGLDPVQFIDQHANRISLLHIKDMDSGDRTFAPVGTGTLPLDGIIEAAQRARGVKYFIVEQDAATKQTPLEAIKISFDNLKQKGYA